MKRASKFILLLLLISSCTPVATPQSTSSATATLIPYTPTFTFIPPTATWTSIAPTPTLTGTPVVCDPHAVDYCITVGYFIFQRPIKPPANTSVDITYRYASTANGTRDPHHGVEFLNKFGTPVYAAGDGVVIFAGLDSPAIYSPWPNYYGNLVVIEHVNNLYTVYAHLSKITLGIGQNVLAGEQVGEVGQTGVAIGSHLHFEVRLGDVEDYYSTQNPELWLIPNQDESGQPFGVIQLSIADKNNSLVKRAEYTVQYFDAQNQPTDIIYYGMTYSTDMLNGEENAAMSDLPAGKYRIALQYNGQLLERFVEVKSGKLTQVVFIVN